MMRRPTPDPAAGSGPAVPTVPVLIPGILRSYTGGAERIDVAPSASAGRAPTVAAVLAALDARCPGLRFRIVDEQGRIRAHVKIFCAGDVVRDLDGPVPPGAEVMLVGALSGG
jgi:molybdopterin synthase sulfur carrier subunit